MSKETDPLASGGSTTEGKLSIGTAVAGVVLAFVGALEPVLRSASDSAPTSLWLRLAAIVAGAAMAMAASFQLTKSRTMVKGNILELLQQAAAVSAPLIAGVVLKKYLDPNTTKAAAVQIGTDGQVTIRPAELTHVLPIPTASSLAPTPAHGVPIPRP